MNRVIITGGNGFIGRHLARKILSCDLDSALLISNTSNVNDEMLLSRAHTHDTSLKFYTADIRNKESICDIFRSERADTCIHLAAKTSV